MKRAVYNSPECSWFAVLPYEMLAASVEPSFDPGNPFNNSFEFPL